MKNFENSKTQIKEKSVNEGFDVVGFTGSEIRDDFGSSLNEFLQLKYHGDMSWLETNLSRRVAPKNLWPKVESIIVLGANYGPDHLPHERIKGFEFEAKGNISVYARNQDYHKILLKRLKRIAQWMCNRFDCEVKVFVDTAPVLEKPIAQIAGVGWQGKHTNIVSRNFGSWLFLGEIYTNLKLSPDNEGENYCGNCQRCLDICPTNAFLEPYKMDARRCISYLTIEHKGHIDEEFRAQMGTRIYGCDDCLSICPWNKFAKTSKEVAFHARTDLEGPELSNLLQLDDINFRNMFRNSPLKRIGRNRFVRNVLIAAGNTKQRSISKYVEPLLFDSSPIVRAMAVWALYRLLSNNRYEELRQIHLASENDTQVAQEWNRLKHQQ